MRRTPVRPYQVTPFTAQIHPGVDVAKINQLLADWADDEILRKLVAVVQAEPVVSEDPVV